jgi:uncharacterized protein DUF6644
MMPAEGAFGAIEATVLAHSMRESLWLYPGVEVAHITGLAVLVGSIAMLDLRVLGVGQALPVRALARFLLPWTLGSLTIIVPSGLMMFSAHASDFIGNPAFLAKLTLLAAAGVNAALFHAVAYRGASAWDTRTRAPVAARAQAAISLALWVSIITCGRLIAYT